VAQPASSAGCLDIERWAQEIWYLADDITVELPRDEARRFQVSAQEEAGAEPEGQGSDSGLDEQPADFGLAFDLLFEPPNKGNPKNSLRAASDLLYDL